MQKFWYFVPVYSLFQLSVAQHANYEICTEKLKNLPSVNCSDPNFYCPKGQHADPSRPLLSLQGCNTLCGRGFELDPIDDIIGRFFLWLLPVIILAAHFNFPPLGWRNTLAVSLGIIGNPIGSFYALLTRQEVFRRHHRRALAGLFPDSSTIDTAADTAANIAAVAAACDEFGWHDPLDFILKRLEDRLQTLAVSAADTPGADGAGAESRISPPQQGDSTLEQNGLPVSGMERQPKTVSSKTVHKEGIEPSVMARDETAREVETEKANTSEASIDYRKPNLGSLLDPLERLYFAEARHELVSHRCDTWLGTLFAIIGLVGAIGGAFVRVWTNRDTTRSSRTIPLVIMTFHLIALVQISGNIGAYTSAFGPLVVFQNLQRKLRSQGLAKGSEERGSLVFPINLEPTDIWKRLQSERETQSSGLTMGDQNGEGSELESQQQLLNSNVLPTLILQETWPSTAGYLGMNPTWRPHNKISSGDKRDRSSWCLLGFAFSFVSTSWLTAFIHSYSAVSIVGFGCRCLIWTVIYLTWLLSFGLDYFLKSSSWCNVTSYAQLWRYTVIKDAMVSLLIVGTIVITHIGMTTTCLCKTGTIFRRESELRIDLLPMVGTENLLRWVQITVSSLGGLVLMFLLIFIVEFDGNTARTVLCPSRKKRHLMQLCLQNPSWMRARAEGQRRGSVVE